MAQIHAGKGPLSDEDFAKIVGLPNILSEDTKTLFMFPKDQATSWELEWIGHIRNSACTPEPGTGARVQRTDIEELEASEPDRTSQKRDMFDRREKSGLQEPKRSRSGNVEDEADATTHEDSDIDGSSSSNEEDDDGEDQEDNLEDDGHEEDI